MARAKTPMQADATPDLETGAIETPVEESPPPPPRLGEQIGVIAGVGRVVVNREFGGLYSETDVSPATVNLRILRLLDDDDLIRCPLPE
ncbi:hypothetical protein [Burkholderia pseudomallei]|uniref:hypothetical protein n=2 Tax=Burkholderia pseudomallei TaxID=28450 RepID=UPI00016AB0A5|nr:hypothetical protein [Burkholderia pseudomallei]KGV60685.1 hypothetical protein X898_768 [Burkholderia pseudomallei ABCPW 91]AIV74610.1 hypothetical protein X994_4415 [Burkholderia pseudomallei]APY94910.1 hypothetical protein BGI50_18040 [Burkholderia pseudomallei]KGC53593.1 hypothetical protein DO65_5368 [Burkholderia pseudomallei]KGC57979.1 hypothetical protein DP56_917 [Burkholderia pseudomallei]